MACVVYVCNSLYIHLLTIIAIHGDKAQNERDWVLNEFKAGKSPIMVATDVASRGIGMIEKRAARSLPFALLVIRFVSSIVVGA
jgi:Helicase conserved C-terminal domain